ncbi:MAG: 1,2-phenylacetyl-CoA epoxidase subunit PaaD [Pseudomonadota bacterium]
MIADLEPARVVREVRALLNEVRDPEIPILTIADLGILRDVAVVDGEIVVIITPTYVGCPAMNTVSSDIAQALKAAGIEDFSIREQLSPAWTTDWLSDAGREKLKSEGIAPPSGPRDRRSLRGTVTCPQCASTDTELVSEFGSTACKALYRCRNCLEPFDYFKCH